MQLDELELRKLSQRPNRLDMFVPSPETSFIKSMT